jgi:hypothetical protein
MKKDWEVGIRPTTTETLDAVARVRGYVAECVAIIDELFPETEEDRKPQPAVGSPFRMFPYGGWVPPTTGQGAPRPPVSDE